MAKYDVVIIGAGPNGLALANYLTKAGAKVMLVECTKWTSKPGKISRSGWLSSWIKGIDSILNTTSSGAVCV